jgi:heme/copper-type cytochrome/quinol oxidase subunit 1
MKYAVEIGSRAMIYIPSFIKISSAIQELMGGIHRHTDSMMIACFYFCFFQNGKVG